VRFSLRECVTAALDAGVVDLFEVQDDEDGLLLSWTGEVDPDSIAGTAARLDFAGFDVTDLGNGEISVREVP
jgi:hypothetical protein